MAATDGVIKVRSVLCDALGHAQVTSRDTTGSFLPLLRCGRLVGPSAPQADPGRGRPRVGRRAARPTRSDLTGLRPSRGNAAFPASSERRLPRGCRSSGSSDDRARQRVVAATTESGRTRQPRSARAAAGHRVTSTGSTARFGATPAAALSAACVAAMLAASASAPTIRIPAAAAPTSTSPHPQHGSKT